MIGKILCCLLGVLAFTNAQKVRTAMSQPLTCASNKKFRVLVQQINFEYSDPSELEDMNENFVGAATEVDLLRSRVV